MSKIYFASDFHLGQTGRLSTEDREKLIVKWMEGIFDDAAELYLVGDLFDFWFEYKSVVPKGFVRFLGCLASWVDSGKTLHIFSGNHDMWMRDYLEKELGVQIWHQPVRRKLLGKEFLIGHGDGLGPGDHGYKFIKRVFANPICQWLFARLHPNFAFALAHYWSSQSRKSGGIKDQWMGREQEWLVAYCEAMIKKENIDFFVFGHRHMAIDCTLSNGSKYYNLGEWQHQQSFGVFDGDTFSIKFFNNDHGEIMVV